MIDILQADSSTRSAEQKLRQWRWKTDQIDYTGVDKYENLQTKMDRHIVEEKAAKEQTEKGSKAPSSKITASSKSPVPPKSSTFTKSSQSRQSSARVKKN